MRLIDADILKADAFEIYTRDYGNIDVVAVEIIDDAVTVDSVPIVRAKWVNPYNNRYGHPCHTCSNCGFNASYQDKNFCPECGAIMDLESEGK